MRQYPILKKNVDLSCCSHFKKKNCCLCGNKTNKGIEVEISWFRGDDEVYKVCKDCQKAKTDEQLMNLGLSMRGVKMTDMIQLTEWQRSKRDLKSVFPTLRRYNVKHEIRQRGKNEFAVFVEHDITIIKDYKNFKGKR